jgi:hypothetical protein
LTIPEAEAWALVKAHADLVTPKKKKKSYVVKRKKPDDGQ